VAKRSNGEGTIYHLDNGSWRAQVSIDGKRVSKTFHLRKEAKDWMTTLSGQVQQGLTYESAKTSVGELLTDWLAIKRTKMRPATDESYRRMARLYIIPHLGALKLQELTAAMIQNFYSDVEKRKLGRRTIVCIHGVLYGFLKHAQRLGLVAQNWAAFVEAPRRDRQEMHVWDESQVSQFLQAVQGDPFYRLAFATGMRRGELLGLQWKDIDWRSGQLQVRRQVYRPEGGGFILQTPKTERGKRGIHLGPGLQETLRKQFTITIPQMQAIAGDAWQEYDLVFPSTRGTPRDGYTVSKEFHQRVTAAGLPQIRLHDIRHTAASIMLLHGEPPVRVAAILGQTLQVLISTYAHYIPDDQERAAQLMDAITTTTSIPLAEIQALHPVAPAGKQKSAGER
jgi:integrase